MNAEINELFEEGITRSRELTDAADEAMNAIDTLAKEAEGLAQRVQDEGTEACQHMRDLASRLQQAEGELEGARGEAEGALDALAGKAGELGTEVHEMLERVKTDLADLAVQQGRLNDSLEAQASSTEADVEELAKHTQEVEQAASRHLDRAGEALNALRSAIDDARNEFVQKQEAWETALNGASTQAEEQVNAWMGGIEGLLGRQAQAMTETANAMVERHNQAMQHLKQRFVTEAPQEVATALLPLAAALEHLGTLASTRQDGLSTRARELAQTAAQALAPLEQIRAALEAAAHLG